MQLVIEIDTRLLVLVWILCLTVCLLPSLSLIYNKSDDMNPTLVQLGHNMLMKLRPFLRTFLKEANKLFRMYIYTTREQDYATEVAKLLDPQCVYFPSTVICQSNNTTMNQRGLDFVLAPENLVIILDDKEHVSSSHYLILLIYFLFGNYYSGVNRPIVLLGSSFSL